MRSRNQFDHYSLDSYRGLDSHRGTRGSGQYYGHQAGNRDSSRETFHGSGYVHGSGPAHHNNMYPTNDYRGSHRDDRDQRQDNRFGNTWGGNYNDRDRSQHHGSHSHDRGYSSANQHGSMSQDWSNRHGIARDYHRTGGSDVGYNQGSGYGHSGNYGYNEGRHSHYNDYRDRDFYGDRNSQYRPGSSFSDDHYGHQRDWADRASDEVRSWFGDDEASRRRRDDDRYYGNDRSYNGGYSSHRNDF